MATKKKSLIKRPRKIDWKGTKDKAHPEWLRVASEDMPDGYPKMHKQSVPGAHFLIDPKTNKITGMITKMPDGVWLAWGACMFCKSFVSQCDCAGGILNPASVEWIYIRTMITQNGDEIPDHGPVSIDSQPVRKYGRWWYRAKERGITFPRQPSLRPNGAVRGKHLVRRPGHQGTAARPSTGHTGAPRGGPKHLLRRQPASTGPEVDVERFDKRKMDATAASKEKGLLNDIEKRMESEPTPAPKRLIKKTNKKIIKRGK
jgi:hypothetical protein